jgi:hypothetical protein
MLLNVGPAADGTIPPEAQKLLRGIGRWLDTNGEAIFETRPWKTFGEGPTRNSGGGFSENKDKPYTSEDIRFTQSKDGKTVYVIVLDRPGKEVTVRSMRVVGQGRVKLLGYESDIKHHINNAGQIVMTLPRDKIGAHAFAFSLKGFQIDLHNEARFNLPGAVRLEPAKATLEGQKINTQINEGRENIGYWDNPDEKIHWLVWLNRPGLWYVRGEFSCAGGPSVLRFAMAGRSMETQVPRTEGWFKPVFVDVGSVRVDKPGVYQLTVQTTGPSRWKPVNVYQLQLAPVLE